MIVSLTIILIFLLLPAAAHAIPTPDMLVSVVNIIPLLTGAVVAAGGGVYYWINKRLGSHVGKLFIGGVFGLFVLLISLSYTWNHNKKADRISEIAMYLRCDPSAHEASIKRYGAQDINSLAMWQQYGNFKIIPMQYVPETLRQQSNATLIAVNSLTIQYHSGIPVANVDGQLYPFSYSRVLELSSVLQANKSKDLYLADFTHITMPPSFYKADKSIFKKFDNIYIVHTLTDNDRYVIGRNGSLRKADVKNKVIKWPVEEETWILDEKRIYFPGIATLLTDVKVADLLEQEDVFLLAPYGNYRRSRKNHEQLYIKKLLRGIDRKRIINIDMNLSTTTRQLAEIAKKLDGKRFVVIGLSKYDWIYEGLDATFEIWEHLDHDSKRFRLLGFNTRLPEVVAISYEATNSKGIIDSLRDPFWNFVKWLNRSTGLSAGAAILLTALSLRLLFYPVAIREARSRMKRAKIKHALQAVKKPLWSGSSPILLRHLKVSSGWEFLGTLVMLLLVFPAYKILSAPPEEFQNISFLWVDNLTQPDYLLSIFVGGLIFYKLRLGSTAKYWSSFVLTIAFVVLLFYVPGSLLVYISGVLAVTLLQDILALKHTESTVNRALLTTD